MEQLIELIKSGSKLNIELALTLSKTQGIDISSYIEEMRGLGETLNISGADDVTFLYNLVNLERLDLDDNELSTIPDSIGNLVNLERLDLYD